MANTDTTRALIPYGWNLSGEPLFNSKLAARAASPDPTPWCPACDGDGEIDGVDCERCDGRGILSAP